jgi:hypothetical protein
MGPQAMQINMVADCIVWYLPCKIKAQLSHTITMSERLPNKRSDSGCHRLGQLTASRHPPSPARTLTELIFDNRYYQWELWVASSCNLIERIWFQSLQKKRGDFSPPYDT